MVGVEVVWSIFSRYKRKYKNITDGNKTFYGNALMKIFLFNQQFRETAPKKLHLNVALCHYTKNKQKTLSRYNPFEGLGRASHSL